jgi:hypothetical protein
MQILLGQSRIYSRQRLGDQRLTTTVALKKVAADVRRRISGEFAADFPPPHVGGYALKVI